MLTNEFKLIAIRPLKGCDPKFLKNLKEGMIYSFYQDCEFTLKESDKEFIFNLDDTQLSDKTINQFYLDRLRNAEIIKAEMLNLINLYTQNRKPTINISAIVGQNGSGKSSLIELFNLAVYKCIVVSGNFNGIKPLFEKQIDDNKKLCDIINDSIGTLLYSNSILSISEKKGIINCNIDSADIVNLDKEFEESPQKKLKLIEDLAYTQYELSSNLDIDIQVHHFTIEKLVNFFRQLKTHIDLYNRRLLEYRIFHRKIIKHLNIELIVSINNHIQIFNSNNISDINFYNILLNYSNSSYNSTILGDWIQNLFHKNDGYQVPIVLNPLRDYGNYDINNELFLLKERILNGIISQINNGSDEVYIGKYKLKNIICSTKHKKYYRGNLSTQKEYSNLIKFIESNKNLIVDTPLEKYSVKHHLIGYLIHKYRTFNQYHLYKYFDKEKSPSDINKEFFLIDKTHLTKKFRTTANFFLNLEVHKKYFYSFNGYTPITFNIQELKNWIADIKSEILINHSPDIEDLLINVFPSIFKLDYIFEYEGKDIAFSGLSSGEVQSLINITTILYHANNISSVHKTNRDSIDKRIVYDSINVILDEVELYYHPELQRSFIYDLIQGLSNNPQLNEKIEGINILLLTHSPFILSDIPSQNVLKLKDGMPQPNDEKNNSFAANIHDLLNDEFFLKDGTMGEFAESKIKELIHFYHRVSIVEFETDQEEKKKNVEALRKEYREKRFLFKFLVDNIGEPVYRSVLENNFNVIVAKMDI